jgi:multisubunit Na+/H+ antiporter MnhF subunit
MTYPTPTNITGLSGMFTYADSIVSNYLGSAILMGLFFIIVIYQVNRGNDIAKTFVASGWVMSIVSIFFYFLELINPTIMFTSISLLVVSSLWAYFQKQ